MALQKAQVTSWMFHNLCTCINFYCAALFISAVLAVGPCLSVTLVYWIQTATDIIKLFSQPDSHIILILRPFSVTRFQGELLHRGVKYTKVGKISNFLTVLRAPRFWSLLQVNKMFPKDLQRRTYEDCWGKIFYKPDALLDTQLT